MSAARATQFSAPKSWPATERVLPLESNRAHATFDAVGVELDPTIVYEAGEGRPSAPRISQRLGGIAAAQRLCQRRLDVCASVFDAWAAEARACGVWPLETFAAGLEQDGAAIRAALTLLWGNALAGGKINRSEAPEAVKVRPRQAR